MRAAILGAMVFEGEARDLAEAEAMFAAGAIELTPCHEAGAVGAMAGIVSPTMPVIVVESDLGNLAFSPINEGLGSALRFGSTDVETMRRLLWLRDAAAPLLDRAIRTAGDINLTELQAEGLRRGDECHNRNVAATTALLLRLAPFIIRATRKGDDAATVIANCSANPHFFLPFSMAACKAVADSAHGVDGSPIVTAICANGVRLGVRVSGLGQHWFLAPSPIGTPRLFPGFTIDDVQPAMGDSYVTETIGLGAFALSAAPAITNFIGGDPAQSLKMVSELRRITAGTSTRFLIPYEGFAGSPVGIDVTKVAETGVSPVVNNGLASRTPGRGQAGAGVTTLPLEPFREAAAALARRAAGV
jgi:hypothetical protein